MKFVAQTLPPLDRDDDRGGGIRPPSTAASVEPYWLELARQAFTRRWQEEGDHYEDSENVYGSVK